MKNKIFRLKNRLKKIKLRNFYAFIFFIFAIPVSCIVKRKRPDLWLICEYENEARDNAYWLYKYIRTNHPKQDVVYAINYESVDCKKVDEIGETVRYGSYKHWVLYLAAKHNISSQKGGKPNAAICYLLEITFKVLKNSRIFLQHGVIMSDLPYLHYTKSRMKLFVCSTKREKEFVEEKFDYYKKKVKNIGLCRFDQLINAKIIKNQILIMPTWREWLFSISKTKFLESDYFFNWNNFLNDNEFNKYIESKNLKVVFFLHRNAQQFASCFATNNQNITIASDKEYDTQNLIKSAEYMITDFSSVSADFAYCNKPITYFQFDYSDYKLMYHPEGYFSYEDDGFGQVCYTQTDMMRAIKNVVNRGFQNEPLYTQRIEKFFTYIDTNNCKRNFEAILSLEHDNGE